MVDWLKDNVLPWIPKKVVLIDGNTSLNQSIESAVQLQPRKTLHGQGPKLSPKFDQLNHGIADLEIGP